MHAAFLSTISLLMRDLDQQAHGLRRFQFPWTPRLHEKTWNDLKSIHGNLLSTLKLLLEFIVEDEKRVKELIRSPRGDGWKDPSLQERFRIKDESAKTSRRMGFCGNSD
jgi:hypothetical protein